MKSLVDSVGDLIGVVFSVALTFAVIFALARAAFAPIDKKLDRIIALLEHSAEHSDVSA